MELATTQFASVYPATIVEVVVTAPVYIIASKNNTFLTPSPTPLLTPHPKE